MQNLNLKVIEDVTNVQEYMDLKKEFNADKVYVFVNYHEQYHKQYYPNDTEESYDKKFNEDLEKLNTNQEENRILLVLSIKNIDKDGVLDCDEYVFNFEKLLLN